MAKVSGDDPSFSIFSHKHARLPDDTVFFTIFPDSSTTTTSGAAVTTSELSSLQLQILQALSPYTADYIWQHEPFNLSVSSISSSCACSSNIPHIHGKVRFGDNLEDEWFVVFLLFEASRLFPSVSVRVWDTDGEFLLIEAAFHLPRWINPDTSLNRVFIRRGDIHIVPRDRLPNPSVLDSLKFLIGSGDTSRAPEPVQAAVKNRISDYPQRAKSNVHRARVRVPASVAQALKHEPCLISLAVEGFYDRDIDTMKFAAKMERFLSRGREEELVCVSVKMSRAMYAQLAQQTFQAPKCYPMPSRSEGTAYQEAELGMKIACGFEMMYQQRSKDGLEGKGGSWEAFKESLQNSGFFEGLLPGSKEYKRLMQKAEDDYRKGSSFTRASETMNAPVRRIDEILALPHSTDNFRHKEVLPSDDDSWLYNGEEELNSALLEREKEMELYNSKHKKKHKFKEHQDVGSSSVPDSDGFDLGDITKTMQAFVQKVSSYKGAEVPENKNLEDVDFDVDRFMKDIESVMRHQGAEKTSGDVDDEEGSSSDMEFDESEDGSDMEEAEDGENAFMDSYSDALNEELKSTSLDKSFIRANEPSSTSEGASNAERDAGADFTPIDVDVNLVKSLLDSFSSQQGLPGPASNLLGLMGVKLPQDGNKGK